MGTKPWWNFKVVANIIWAMLLGYFLHCTKDIVFMVMLEGTKIEFFQMIKYIHTLMHNRLLFHIHLKGFDSPKVMAEDTCPKCCTVRLKSSLQE